MEGTEMKFEDYASDKLAQGTILAAFDQYVEMALWSSTDSYGEPLDDTYSYEHITTGARERMLTDVTEFLAVCWGDVWEDVVIDLSNIEPRQVGGDFWLTRNGHGAGFWDRGLGEVGQQLTELATSFGSCALIEVDNWTLCCE